jgi:RNA 2',3'-cyclic 3'-phosphodiesterase
LIRLFAAVPVPADIAEDLTQWQSGVEGARWRPEEALHLTLRFFGDVPETTAADIDTELASVQSPPFEVEVHGAGSFGEGPKARAIWAGVGDNAPLRALAAKCEKAARRAGVEPENRAYNPHVTLAYLKRAEADAVAAWIGRHNLLRLPPFRVTWFGLYSSWQTPSGSRYELEREYPLA